MRRRGIFSGSFDPIHLGHERIIRDVLEKTIVDEIIIVPSGTTPYRKPTVDVTHLRAMAALALRQTEHVSIAEESQLKGVKNTVDTLRAIMRSDPDARHYYIIGADKLAGILHWREVKQIFALCELIVYPRVGYNAQELCGVAAGQGARLQLLSVPPVNMSSSLVRTQISLLSDAGDMIKPQVARYIAQNGLYAPDYERMIRPQMTAHRFAHTLGVRKLAVELAYHHHLPMQKAAVAALLHDSAKCMKLSQLQAVAKQYQLTEDKEVLGANALLHGKVGAVLAQVKYQVHDEDVLNAIRYHTTGRSQMSPLELCVFVADAAEPERSDYPGLERIRSAMWVDLRLAALLSLEGTSAHLRQNNQNPGLLTTQAIEDLRAILYPQENQTQDNIQEVS